VKVINHGLKEMFNFAFDNLNSFFYMDGHGIYVWSVFFIVIISTSLMFIFYKNELRKIRKKIIDE
jgi:heme exporter protein D